MNEKDIRALAMRSRLLFDENYKGYFSETVVEFGRMVEAMAREECAKICAARGHDECARVIRTGGAE